MNLSHGFLFEIVFHAKPLHGVPVQFDPQARRLRHGDVPALNVKLFQQRVRINIDTGNGRPARLLQNRTQMNGKGGRQSRADHLQPERHLGLRR